MCLSKSKYLGEKYRTFFMLIVILKEITTNSRMIKMEKEFYREHGPITDPGEYAFLYEELPRDVGSLCSMIQGLIVHRESVGLHGGETRNGKDVDVDHRKVERLLEKITGLNDSPLSIERGIEERARVVCRDFSVLLCSMLRHGEIPARSRCGYAVYLTDPDRDFVYDHWLCEYWDGDKWIKVDAEIDQLELDAWTRGDVDPLDVSSDLFMGAGDAWKAVREGRYEEHYFGEPESHYNGWRLLKMQLLLDLACLNKREMLATDTWGLAEKDYKELNEKELGLLDEVADHLDDFDEMRNLYENNPELRIDRVDM